MGSHVAYRFLWYGENQEIDLLQKCVLTILKCNKNKGKSRNIESMSPYIALFETRRGKTMETVSVTMSIVRILAIIYVYVVCILCYGTVSVFVWLF
jgi:hypothetical protein